MKVLLTQQQEEDPLEGESPEKDGIKLSIVL